MATLHCPLPVHSSNVITMDTVCCHEDTTCEQVLLYHFLCHLPQCSAYFSIYQAPLEACKECTFADMSLRQARLQSFPGCVYCRSCNATQ